MYKLDEGAGVINNGYFDVPICDEYSNKPEARDKRYVDEFNMNKILRNVLNNNKDEYIVHQYPTRPSSSLYFETDNAGSSYYNPNYINKYYNTLEQFSNKGYETTNKQKHFIWILIIFVLLFILFCCK